MTETHKQSLFARNVVVDARNKLVLVSACGSNSREVVGACACVVRCRPETHQLRGSGVKPGRRNDVVYEWDRSGSAPRARPLSIHEPSAGVINLVDYNRLAVRTRASIVADTRRETRLTYFREIAGGFFRVGNRGCEGLARAQPKTFPAKKPKRLA